MATLPILYDGYGRKQASGFDAGSRSITRIKNWLPTNTETNDLIIGDGELMRARSRKLSRENPWAGGGIDSFVANAIGSGIIPRSAHPTEAQRLAIDKLFSKWTRQADATGRSDFYGLESLACRAIKTDGELFVRYRYRLKADRLVVPLQLQLLEADHVPYWKEENTDQYYTRTGIKFNQFGQRQSYYMYRDHPGSRFHRDTQLYEVPAAQVLHCYEVKRPGQIRGYPWLTPCIIMLYDIKQLMDAALLRHKVENLLSVFIKRTTADGNPLGAEDEGNGKGNVGLTPGAVNYLEAGQEPVFLNPPGAGPNLVQFLETMLRAVARAMGITYEQLTGNLNGVNFSSIRAGVLEFRRWCEAFQYQVMMYQFCEPIWAVWIEQALLAGALGAQAQAEFAEHPDWFYDHRWDPQAWPWVDPLNDIKAAVAECRAGYNSRSNQVAARGENPLDIDNQQQQDNARADEKGLKYDSDGRNPVNGGASGQPDPNTNPDGTPKTGPDGKAA